MIYDYLTSPTFRMQLGAIVEDFSQMKTDLDSEKRSTLHIWKQCEKQIEKVSTNTLDFVTNKSTNTLDFIYSNCLF